MFCFNPIEWVNGISTCYEMNNDIVSREFQSHRVGIDVFNQVAIDKMEKTALAFQSHRVGK